MKRKTLSIIIPTHNRHMELKQSVSSILNQEIPSRLSIKILIRDNSSNKVIKEQNKLFIDNIAARKTIPIKLIDVTENGKPIIGDKNIYESIWCSDSDYCFVLPDDDFLLKGSLKKIDDVVHKFTPNIIHLNTLEVNNINAEYYLRNIKTNNYSEVIIGQYDTILNGLGSFIGLQSFVFSTKALKKCNAPKFSEVNSFINWTCASQFLSLAIYSRIIHDIKDPCVAWRNQNDKINLSVRSNWLYVDLIQGASMLQYFYKSERLTTLQYTVFLNNHIKSADSRHGNVFKIFRYKSLLVKHYGLKNVIIFIYSLYIKNTRLLVTNGYYNVLYIHHQLLKLLSKYKLYKVKGLKISVLPYSGMYMGSCEKITETNQIFTSASSWWLTQNNIYKGVNFPNFRREKPVVGIMSGYPEQERYSHSHFEKQLLSCPIGFAMLCRVSESPLGNPPLRATYPFLSSLSILHIWYWYQLVLIEPDLDIINIKVYEFGGGFGNMCRLLLVSNPNILSYNIFDFEHINKLQSDYIKSILHPILHNKIEYRGQYKNVVLNNRKGLKNIFIATFSLSETTEDYFINFLKNDINNYDAAIIAFQHKFIQNDNLSIVEIFTSENKDVFNFKIIKLWTGASVLFMTKQSIKENEIQ